MPDVGELFVRIRPAPGTQAALTSEASGPVAAAGRDLSKIFLAAFAIGGIATTIKSVVTAATEHQAAFAVLAQTTKDAGASNTLFGQSIESLLEKEARLKGFTDEDLASSFVRLVSATKNSAQAFKDLGLAEDVARARHIDLANAALAISKAEQGSATALQRLGIVVHPVTAAVDALKVAHENAIVAGAKFTDAQKQEYNQALETAKVQDKEATRLEVLSTLRQRFGGDAAVFAQTAAGQFARLQADFHQFEVSIGTGLLGGLATASEAVGSFFTRAENNQGLRQGITSGLNEIKTVAETVGPPLLEVAKAAGEVAKAIGAPAILAGIAAYKTIGVVQSAIASGQAFYTRTLAASRSETIADTSAQGKQTAALTANSEALAAQATAAKESQTVFASALTTNTESITAQTAALERLAEVSGQTDLTAATQGAVIPTQELAAATEGANLAFGSLAESLAASTLAEGELAAASGIATDALEAQALAAARLAAVPQAELAAFSGAGEATATGGLDEYAAASGRATTAAGALTDALAAQADVVVVAEARFADAVAISTVTIDAQTAALERLAAVGGIAPAVETAPVAASAVAVETTVNEAPAVGGLQAFTAASVEATTASGTLADALAVETEAFVALGAAALAAGTEVAAATAGSAVVSTVAEIATPAAVAAPIVEPVAPVAAAAAEQGAVASSSVASLDARTGATARLAAATGLATDAERTFAAEIVATQGALTAVTVEIDAQALALERRAAAGGIAPAVPLASAAVEEIAAPVAPAIASTEGLDVQTSAVGRLSAATELAAGTERTFSAALVATQGVVAEATVGIQARTAALAELVVQETLAAEAAARGGAVSEFSPGTQVIPVRAAPVAAAAPAAEAAPAAGFTASAGAITADTAALEANAAAAERAVVVYGPLGDVLATVTTQAETAAAGQEALTGSLGALQAALAGDVGELDAVAAAEVAAGTAAADAAPAITKLSLSFAGATAEQIAYNDALLAGAPASAALIVENTGVAAALARVDAARAAAIAESAGSTVAAETETAALARLTAADTVAASAAIRLGLATQATVAYFAETATAAQLAAAAETEAAAASGGVLAGAGRLGLAAVGGTAGAAAIGVGLLVAGIYKLVTAENVGTEATHGLEHAVGDLNSAMHTDAVDKLTLAQDKLNLSRDNAALSASKAAHGSAEYQQLLLNVANDSIAVTDAQNALRDSLAVTASEFAKQKQKVQALIDADLILGLVGTGANRRRGPAPADQPAQVQRIQASAFVEGIQQTIATSKDLSPILLHNYQLLEQFAEVFGRVPPTKTWTLILNNKDAKITLENIVREVDGLAPKTAAAARRAAKATADAFNTTILSVAGQYDLGPTVSQAFALLPSEVGPTATAAGESLGGGLIGGIVDAVTQGGAAVAAAAAAATAIAKHAAVEAQAQTALAAKVDPLKQDIANYQTDLATLRTEAVDIATQGALALTQAINQAKQNLNSIGQSIADSLFQFIDKPLQDAATRISDTQAKLSQLNDKESLARLGQEVILPGGRRLSDDPTKAIAQLEALKKRRDSPALDAYILQFRSLALQVQGDQNTVQQNAANLIKTAAQTRLANLTDLFNKGQISEKTLERDVTALLEKHGLTAKTARERGVAFADTLAGERTGLVQQAAAINAVPAQAGSGLIPSITQPIDTLNATQKALAANAAQQRTDQLNATKDQTKILSDIHAAQKAQQSSDSVSHNPGERTRRAVQLVGTGSH